MAAAAAAACRRGLLLHHQQQWPTRLACPARSISQLVKTNGRRAFLVDTLALVTYPLLPLASLPQMPRSLEFPPESCSAKCATEC